MSEGGQAIGVCRQCGTRLIYPRQTICQHCGGQATAAPGAAGAAGWSLPAAPVPLAPSAPAPVPPDPSAGGFGATGPAGPAAPPHPPAQPYPPAPYPPAPYPAAPYPAAHPYPVAQPHPAAQPYPPAAPQAAVPRPVYPRPQLPTPGELLQQWQSDQRLQAQRARRRKSLLTAVLASFLVAGLVPAILLLAMPAGAPESSARLITDSPSPTQVPTAVPSPTPRPTINLFPEANPLTPVGTLKDPRSNHTATLLADGRVVIIGGISSRGAMAATDYVEIYDPRQKSFGLAGKLVVARYDHTATLLKDGTILVAGGRGPDGGPVASAEIYNPRSKTSRAIGAMAVPRYEASAVLLDDGRVLIAGGSDAGGWVLEPEVYNPRTAAFTSLGRVSWAAGTVPIVRLGDGRVLIAGGGAAGQATNAAMLFDPRKNVFVGPDEGAGSIEVARTESTSCRLAGSGDILIAGGMGPDGVDATAEIYVMGRYEMGKPEIALISPRVHATLTALPDGGALIVGGESIYGQPTATIERWKPKAERTIAVGTMGQPRSHHTATLLRDGTVLIVGGRSSLTTVLAEAGIYRP